jgi:hypothetical protein
VIGARTEWAFPVAPHSVESAFLPLGDCRKMLSENERFRGLRQWMSGRRRGDVEAVVFDCLGRPSLLDQAVVLVMERVEARIQATANACATSAPQGILKTMSVPGNGDTPHRIVLQGRGLRRGLAIPA